MKDLEDTSIIVMDRSLYFNIIKKRIKSSFSIEVNTKIEGRKLLLLIKVVKVNAIKCL